MEIKENKTYFLKVPLPGYEFGKEREDSKDITLNKKTGVFLIGREANSYFFQTMLSNLYVEIEEKDLNSFLGEWIDEDKASKN